MCHYVQGNNNGQLLVRNHGSQNTIELDTQIAQRKKKHCQPRILYPVKVSLNNENERFFNNENEINMFPDKDRKNFVAS